MSIFRQLLGYRRSCFFLYGMTSRGFDAALGRRVANLKTRGLIAIAREVRS